MERQPRNEISIEDLLADKRFLDWAKHPNEKSDKYWDEWVANDPDRRKKLEEAVLLLESVEFKILKGQEDRVWNKVDKGNYSSRYQKKEDVPTVKQVFSNWRLNRVAAIALIFITIGSLLVYLSNSRLFSVNPELITVVTKNGERKNVSLPDGTEVAMNSGSQLSYPSFFSKRRDVNLTGEAFFRVAKDKTKPFVVHSAGYTTQALGTSFNVKAYNDDLLLSVALKTGKVVIESETDESWNRVFLVPGQKLVVEEGKAFKNQVVDDDLSWQDGVLVLNSVGFSDFVRIIERWYGVDVVVEGIPSESWKVKGRFNNKSLAIVLESISFAENIDYTIQGDKVRLSFR